MFTVTVTRPSARRLFSHRQTLAESCTPENIFNRLVEESEDLRRLCGFDSELFRAAELIRHSRA